MTRFLFLLLVLAPGFAVAQQPTRPGWPQPMNNNRSFGYTIFNQNEFRFGDGNRTWRWDSESWYGGNINRVFLKTEGNLSDGTLEEGEAQLLASHAFSSFFNFQVGGRYEVRPQPSRGWMVVGLEGLAPTYLEVGAYAYFSTQGRVAARIEGHYDLFFTQRLVLQPQFELNFNAQADPRRELGAGLTELDSGLRLRYEFTREFAPYVGVTYTKKYGHTADFAALAGERTERLSFAAGLRFWF